MSKASRLKGPMRRWLRQLLPRRSADHSFPPLCVLYLSVMYYPVPFASRIGFHVRGVRH
jgi:hypothetical protein